MNALEKEKIYEEAQLHATSVVDKLKDAYLTTVKTVKNIKARLKHAGDVDRIIESQVLENSEQRIFELEHLKSSPYFVCCDVDLGEKGREKIYFSKFNYSEENIYSWTSPASSIRYDDPGEICYRLPNGRKRSGKLFRKDQFMIAEGKIIFMAREAIGSPRQLIHQEHLERSKDTFVLPEIVELMEKKQDEVIRADYRGSYLISGPAGSGKTTLALHRAAYLAMSPETSEHFASASIIVFVHDNSTKKYFSGLLPQLGIKNVEITIFSDWAMKILGITGYDHVYRFGGSEEAKDKLEFFKNKCLRLLREPIRNPQELAAYYKRCLSAEAYAAVEAQLDRKQLDRFDLTILLESFAKENNGIRTMQSYIAKNKQKKETIKKGLLPLEYSLIIIDEAENYLKEQIELIKGCADHKKAVLYVGDLAQQTKLFTLKDWKEAGESFPGDRKVVLYKVYRNTKEILEYIRGRGYDIEIPEGIKHGNKVVEIVPEEDEEKQIEMIIEKNKQAIIGIIHLDSAYLEKYEKIYNGNNRIQVLSIDEAQGVEFDIVVFIENDNQGAYEFYDQSLIEEKKKVLKDLNYVAMTRAMRELYVIKN